MTHILLINEFYHPDICASAVVATDHLEKLAALRPEWRFTVLAGNRAWDDANRVHPPDETINGVRVIRVDRPAVRRDSLISRGLGFAAFQRNVLRAAKQLDHVDLVIGTTAPPQGGMIAAKVARMHGCPFIYKVLDLYPDLVATLGRMKADSFVYRQWLRLDTNAMRAAAAVVTISTPITQRIARTRGIDPAKLHTIHDGYDASRLVFAGANAFATESNPEMKLVVQYAGNMGLSHPMDTMVSAARQMESDPRVLFQFIGNGPQREALKMGLPSNARLIDYQPADRLGQVLATADVCLISQHDAMFDQAMPYKVYASLAAAKPVIFLGNDGSEIAQWVNTHGAGMAVHQGDTTGLIGAIRSCVGDAGRTMGAGARGLFDRSLRSVFSAQEWLTLIEKAIRT